MYLLPFFTLCEDSLQLFNQVVDSYGLIVACCLLWVGAMLVILGAGIAALPAITVGCRKGYRSHVDSLLAEVSNTKDSYGNCPNHLSKLGVRIEMLFGANLNWDHANMDLLRGTSKSKKKARQALLGENWQSFVRAVPRCERTQLYKAAVSLQKAFLKLELDKLREHQALVAPMGFAVTAVSWNRESHSWSFSYACKIIKKGE